MKPLSLLAAMWLIAPSIAAAAIEFTAVFAAGQEVKFSLRDTGTESASSWFKLGDKFSGYTLTSYDAKTEILLLVKGEDRMPLHLIPGKTANGAPPADKPGEHVTQAGDMAAKIAQRYDQTVAQLAELNPGVDLARLRVGQALRLR
ncbi:MAG TPA: LysM domain-containing protein [Opitutaceae bacterium]|nr:LysM domain-containing protein [Opitutaceae bacterium]